MQTLSFGAARPTPGKAPPGAAEMTPEAFSRGLPRVGSQSELQKYAKMGRSRRDMESHLNAPLSQILVKDEENAVTMTKVIATLGPASRSVETLEEMLQAGMRAARFDFSYGDKQYHQETLNNLRQAIKKSRKMCAVIMDVQGPEVTVEKPESLQLDMVADEEVVITSDVSRQVSSKCLPLNLPNLASLVAEGDEVFVGQYLFTGSETSSVYLTVRRIVGSDVVCECHNTATLEGQITVHISNVKNSMPSLTESDKDAIKTWGKSNGVDFLSLSFCRSAADVKAARAVLDEAGLTRTGILAKIESKEGLLNLNEILPECYGVIISRGNLGLDVGAERMFLTQKAVLQQCNMHGKPAIVTRVVDTMTDAPRPTRAEATDVANAILDGADCIMLGAETLRGQNVVTTVKTVLQICAEAEKCFDYTAFYKGIMETASPGAETGVGPVLSEEDALASSAVRAADKVHARLIVCFTETGRTASNLAKFRPPMPILTVVVPKLISNNISWGFSGDSQARQSLIHRGTVPILADPTMGPRRGVMDDSILQFAVNKAHLMGLVRSGDPVVVSQRIGASSVVKVVTVGLDVPLSGAGNGADGAGSWGAQIAGSMADLRSALPPPSA